MKWAVIHHEVQHEETQHLEHYSERVQQEQAGEQKMW